MAAVTNGSISLKADPAKITLELPGMATKAGYVPATVPVKAPDVPEKICTFCIMSKLSQNAVRIQSKCSLRIHSKRGQNAVKMHSNAVKIQSKFIPVKIQSKCSQNAVKI